MTSSELRQSFLDFFREKGHTIVPAASLLPDSPNLLFTNAGMNQFVPIFLGERKPDVAAWNGAIRGADTRAADTQKCIRAGGKHNDLEDVGMDTYHHTFFEMLGNWSFGDYFKRDAIAWGWELLVERWKFPPGRLYATIYQPDKAAGDPSERDEEAWACWAEKFRSAGLDPALHIVDGNRKDNFWMMGDTGPCGPCSEVHVDLTPAGDTCGALVNKGTAACIEIWNLVFIQFNANPDGTFSPLPAQHVDTGMGFERVCSILQGTGGFTRFADAQISNYETDVFRPLFDTLGQISGRNYGSSLPGADLADASRDPQVAADIAFRVIADHVRALSFSIADGILPGNNDRNYVLRRILRRAVRYGRNLGLHEPFLHRLVEVLARTMGDVFPELRARRAQIEEVILREETMFNRTLDEGLRIFERFVEMKTGAVDFRRMLHQRFRILSALEEDPDRGLEGIEGAAIEVLGDAADLLVQKVLGGDRRLLQQVFARADLKELMVSAHEIAGGVAAWRKSRDPEVPEGLRDLAKRFQNAFTDFLVASRHLEGKFNGEAAFLLYDTYGFPLDLTELMARERGLTVETARFEELMEAQRARGRAGQKKQIISVSELGSEPPTRFLGYDDLSAPAEVLDVARLNDRTAVVTDATVFYAEMGGQVGDTGEMHDAGQIWRVADTRKQGDVWLHFLEGEEGGPAAGAQVDLFVDAERRAAIQRHHTATHLLHWALHEVVSRDATQKGSYVGHDKLTFDFSGAPLTPAQVADVERLVNARILENAAISWSEVFHAEVRGRPDIMQFFGDKYGERVRVVQVGGQPGAMDGYSMELCGGTHARATGEIGLFRIVSEGAIAAGVRRIEALAGLEAYRRACGEREVLVGLAAKLNSPLADLAKRIEALMAQQKELEKQLKEARQRDAARQAAELLSGAEQLGDVPFLAATLRGADGDQLHAVAEEIKARFPGVAVLVAETGGTVALAACVGAGYVKRFQAGKIIARIAPLVGGKGGGRSEFARGAGDNASGIGAALEAARKLVAG